MNVYVTEKNAYILSPINLIDKFIYYINMMIINMFIYCFAIGSKIFDCELFSFQNKLIV